MRSDNLMIHFYIFFYVFSLTNISENVTTNNVLLFVMENHSAKHIGRNLSTISKIMHDSQFFSSPYSIHSFIFFTLINSAAVRAIPHFGFPHTY